MHIEFPIEDVLKEIIDYREEGYQVFKAGNLMSDCGKVTSFWANRDEPATFDQDFYKVMFSYSKGNVHGNKSKGTVEIATLHRSGEETDLEFGDQASAHVDVQKGYNTLKDLLDF